MPSRTPPRRLRALCLAAAAGVLALALAGCATGRPGAIAAGDLAEAQTFPYFRVYWVGRTFAGNPLAAVDGLKGYIASVGDSVYYGDCVQKKGIFGGGSCSLPLQVTTVVYHEHSNRALGEQRNLVLRGVPATAYDEGRSLELYTGRVAIDIFADTPAHALAAAEQLRPVNAPGAAGGPLPPPVYCPGLWGPTEEPVERVIYTLPHQPCQRAAATNAFTKALRAQ